MTPKQRARLEEMRGYLHPETREALDAALAHIDALEARVVEAERTAAALRRYVKHDAGCVRWLSSEFACGCGLAAALTPSAAPGEGK